VSPHRELLHAALALCLVCLAGLAVLALDIALNQ